MSFKVKLEVAGKSFNVLNMEYELFQETDATGRPSSIVRGGKINVSVESTGDTTLFELMTNNFERQDGKIVFIKRDSDATLKELNFTEAYITKYSETFSGGGMTNSGKFDNVSDSNPTAETVTFSAKSISMGTGEHINEWV